MSFTATYEALNNPPLTFADVLDRLARSGLPRSVAELRRL